MQKTLYTLLIAGISLAACNKQENAIPTSTSGTTTVTDIDFKDAKAYVRSGQFKTAEEGIVIDYDFYIKETSTDKYTAAIRLNGIRANGQKLNGVKFNGSQDAYRAIVIGINNTKKEPDAPAVAAKVETNFAILLDGAKGDKVGDVIVFDPFTYKGDLVNEVVDATVKLTIGGGDVVIKDNSTVILGGSTISIKENTNGTIYGGNMYVYDDVSLFVTGSGMTVTQDPVFKKVTIKNTKPGETVGEADGKVVVIVSGDPADMIAKIYFKPAPISANDPKDPKATITLPTMEFQETHYNKQLGLHRFVSTKTWGELYGKKLGADGFGEGWARITMVSR